MSLQRFDGSARSGFRPGIDPSLASRQLRVSLGVVLALALATVGSAAVLRPDPYASPDPRWAPTVNGVDVEHLDRDAAIPADRPNDG